MPPSPPSTHPRLPQDMILAPGTPRPASQGARQPSATSRDHRRATARAPPSRGSGTELARPRRPGPGRQPIRERAAQASALGAQPSVSRGRSPRRGREGKGRKGRAGKGKEGKGREGKEREGKGRGRRRCRSFGATLRPESLYRIILDRKW